MGKLWELGLANALVVATIAPLAFVLGRLAKKRPAWTHAVWVVVLLKLVTPPISGVPIGWSLGAIVDPPVESAKAPIPAERVALQEFPKPLVAEAPVAIEPPIVERPRPARTIIKTWTLPSWPVLLGSIWLGGSVWWGLLATWRIVRFDREMKRTDDAPADIAWWVSNLSEKIGLARTPRVVIAPGRISPMVWALGGRACLVVPEGLWARLDDAQRSAMLVHELAHLRRRDHWVRILELFAIGLFWWHPALWLARRELHRAEELCCDLWVVWALPQSKKNYAAALVEAVEFLSESPPKKLPVGASGMGQVEDLSRRIGMILRGDAPRGLGRFGSIAILGLGFLLLPWMPTFASPQEAPAKPEEAKPKATNKAEDGKQGEDALPDDLDARIQTAFDKYETLRKASYLSEDDRLELEKIYDHLKWSADMLKKKYVPPNVVKTDILKLAQVEARIATAEPRAKLGVQVDLDDATSNDSAAYRAAKTQLQYAQSTYARLLRYQARGIVSQDELEAAKSQVEVAKANLAEVVRREKAREQAEAEARKLAFINAKDAFETAKAKFTIQKAKVATAVVKRDASRAAVERVAALRQAAAVSNEEVEKAKSALQIAEALHQEAIAEQEQAAVEVSQAERRYHAIEAKPAAVRIPPVEVISGPPGIDGRVNELEKKLDRVLKEIEAMRKEQAAAKPGTGKSVTTEDLKGELLEIRRAKNEILVRELYEAFLHRKPEELDLREATNQLTIANGSFDAVASFVNKIMSKWKDSEADAITDILAKLVDDKKITINTATYVIFRSVTGESDTSSNEQLKQTGDAFSRFRKTAQQSADHREAMRQYARDMILLRDQKLEDGKPM